METWATELKSTRNRLTDFFEHTTDHKRQKLQKNLGTIIKLLKHIYHIKEMKNHKAREFIFLKQDYKNNITSHNWINIPTYDLSHIHYIEPLEPN